MDSSSLNFLENKQYFFHKDHTSATLSTGLGSSTQISDISANIIHHIEYMPYGETFVEQRSNWGTNYKFNGKELDEETGFYYYGARYYNPDISIWLSVDPLSDKYPSLSPYNYCANNPIKYVDPDGMRIDWVESVCGKIYWDDNATSQETTKKGETYLGRNVIVGTHNRDANGNEPVNSATFDLYLESNKSGSSATINGNTVPSDISKFGTLAEGLYSAKFGRRNAEKYKDELAIRIYNLDGTDGLPTLNGNPNKANSDLLTGILFHTGNPYQESLLDSRNRPVWSHGCLTSGCGKGSADKHNAFMQTVGSDFNGSFYLRGKPTQVEKNYNFNYVMPSFALPKDNTFVVPRIH